MSDGFHSVFQHPADLILGITFGEYTGPGLTVLAQRAVTSGPLALALHIIGESHWVRVSVDGAIVLDEILGCTDLDALACHRLHGFGSMQPFVEQVREGYRIAVTFSDAPDPAWPPFPADDVLALDFPVMDGYTPITRIGWQLAPDRARWWTLHTYPHDDRLTHVYSETEWVIDP